MFSSESGVVFQDILGRHVSQTIPHLASWPLLTPGACAVSLASALTAANSFNALPLSLAAAAAAAAFCLLFLACAAAAICLSRTVEASDRESSAAAAAAAFLVGGMIGLGGNVTGLRRMRRAPLFVLGAEFQASSSRRNFV